MPVFKSFRQSKKTKTESKGRHFATVRSLDEGLVFDSGVALSGGGFDNSSRGERLENEETENRSEIDSRRNVNDQELFFFPSSLYLLQFKT